MSEEQEQQAGPISSANFPTSPKVVFIRVTLLISFLIAIMVYVAFGAEEEEKEQKRNSSLTVEDILSQDPQELGEELEIDLEAADD